MKTNAAGIDLIKACEGLRLRPYQDVVGVWTVGFGHTGPDARDKDPITEAEADTLLRADLVEAEKGVTRLVKVPLSENQFSALVSFVFNLGAGAFGNSTMLKKLNKGDYLGAAAEFGRWNKAGRKVMLGLTRRRKAERLLFLSP